MRNYIFINIYVKNNKKEIYINYCKMATKYSDFAKSQGLDCHISSKICAYYLPQHVNWIQTLRKKPPDEVLQLT